MLVYKIPYRRARAWPSARASKGILHTKHMQKLPVNYIACIIHLTRCITNYAFLGDKRRRAQIRALVRATCIIEQIKIK